jgi:hypothetical protein
MSRFACYTVSWTKQIAAALPRPRSEERPQRPPPHHQTFESESAVFSPREIGAPATPDSGFALPFARTRAASALTRPQSACGGRSPPSPRVRLAACEIDAAAFEPRTSAPRPPRGRQSAIGRSHAAVLRPLRRLQIPDRSRAARHAMLPRVTSVLSTDLFHSYGSLEDGDRSASELFDMPCRFA